MVLFSSSGGFVAADPFGGELSALKEKHRQSVLFLSVSRRHGDKVEESTPKVGTGFFITGNGHFITARHMFFPDEIEPNEIPEPYVAVGQVGSTICSPEWPVELLRWDPDHDLALGQLMPGPDTQPVQIGSPEVVEENKDLLLTLGFPGGENLTPAAGRLNNRPAQT